jgi:hypothetical protein
MNEVADVHVYIHRQIMFIFSPQLAIQVIVKMTLKVMFYYQTNSTLVIIITGYRLDD